MKEYVTFLGEKLFCKKGVLKELSLKNKQDVSLEVLNEVTQANLRAQQREIVRIKNHTTLSVYLLEMKYKSNKTLLN